MRKVLHVVGKMHRAGMETLIMNIYRNIDRHTLQFDFCVHYPEKGNYDSEIMGLGGKIYYMPKVQYSNIIELKTAIKNFLKDHNDYIAIHVHYSCIGFLYFKYGNANGIKNLIYHAHNSGREKGIKANIRYIMEQYSIKYANIFFACSDLAGQYNYHGKNYIMLNNGVDTDKFKYNEHVRNEYKKKMDLENNKSCLHIGRFDIQKNHSFLINFFNDLYKIDNNYILLLLGDGPMREEIQNKVDAMDCRKNIRFLGSRNDINNLLSVSDIFLLPSLYEGLPLTLIEAQASGIKCIISNTITKEANLINENVKYLSIKNKKIWINEIINTINYKRIDTSEIVRKKGFDNHDIANNMYNFYMNLKGD